MEINKIYESNRSNERYVFGTRFRNGVHSGVEFSLAIALVRGVVKGSAMAKFHYRG